MGTTLCRLSFGFFLLPRWSKEPPDREVHPRCVPHTYGFFFFHVLVQRALIAQQPGTVFPRRWELLFVDRRSLFSVLAQCNTSQRGALWSTHHSTFLLLCRDITAGCDVSTRRGTASVRRKVHRTARAKILVDTWLGKGAPWGATLGGRVRRGPQSARGFCICDILGTLLIGGFWSLLDTVLQKAIKWGPPKWGNCTITLQLPPKTQILEGPSRG